MTALPPNYLEPVQVRHTFNQAATSYDTVAHLQTQVGEGLFERVVGIKLAPKTVLDVGTGTGYLLAQLKQSYKSAQIYALDIAENMLQQARKKNYHWFRRNPHFICGDAHQLPFADQSIDLLMSNLTLQWCHNLPQVLQEFARVLSPKGVLIFSTLGPDTLKELRYSWATVDHASHVNLFTDMHELGDALYQAGLVDPVMDVDWLTYHYANGYELMHELKELGAHNITAGKPTGLMGKNKFNAVLTAYEQFRTPSGLPATYEVIYGHAVGQAFRQTVTRSSVTTIPISHIGRNTL